MNDLMPGDTVSTILHTEGLVLKPDVGLDGGVLFWEAAAARVGRLHWSKVSLLRRGSSEDVARAERLLALHLAHVARTPEIV
jgi:hypothetical protein